MSVRRELEYFFEAVRFFTRLPVPAWVGHSSEALQRSSRYFPAVGLIVGGVAALVFVATSFFWPTTLAVLAAMASTLLLTGAFHEDGWGDMVDGFGGGWDKAQILTIMKDSRIGSYGAIGIVLMLLAKAAALIELAGTSPATAALALLVAHPLSRLAATTVLHALPYARSDDGSKAAPVAQRLNRAELAMASAFGLLPALVLLTPLQTLAVLALAALVTLWLARLFLRRLGGHTGDLLGAVQQAAELACYVGILGAAS